MNDNQTSLSGNFFFTRGKNGELGVRTEDLVIDGLSFPKFTWQWVGLGLAQGVLGLLGGELFGALAHAIFGGTGKSLGELLEEQLEAFTKIIQQAITENEIRRYTAEVRAYLDLYREYSDYKKIDDLQSLRRETAPALSNLESLEFPAYRTYMSAASLRLSILQEAYRRKLVKIDNVEAQMEECIAHHQKTVTYIDSQTDPRTYVDPNTTQNLSYHCFANGIEYNCNQGIQMPTGARASYFKAIDFDQFILGHELKGYLPFTVGMPPETKPRVHTPDEIVHDKQLVAASNEYLADRLTDFAWLRQTVKAENTDLGGKMVEQWTTALAKMKQKP
jgi:hypothetical protein